MGKHIIRLHPKAFGEDSAHLNTFLGQIRIGDGRSEPEEAQKLQGATRRSGQSS